MTDIVVNAAGCRYEVVVGPLAYGRDRLRELARGQVVPVVTDERVWALHAAALVGLLPVKPLFVPEGEEAKCWGELQRLISRFAELNLDRSRPVLAFGGGSIGDLTGLAASLFKRGCPVVYIPTTLLSQVDSAVGGKTAIDAEGQKNLVGTFHQPALVLADVALLDTLDQRQLRAGYAEVVKYALIGEEPRFDWLEEHGPAILSGDRQLREQVVTKCLASKARLVAADPEDRSGVRALLNLGHTFGHALESAAGLGALLHGEAVAVGMVLAFDFSVELGLCPAAEAERVRRHLRGSGLPTTLGDTDVDRSTLLPLMGADKKNEGGELRLILVRGIGQAFVAKEVASDRVAAFLEQAP